VRFIDWITQSVGDLAEPTPGKEWVWLVGLLIVTAPGVLAAFWARQAKGESKATNKQVINDHQEQPVLRVDIDEKHETVIAKFDELNCQVAAFGAVLREHGDRLESIEDHLRN
jgi:hypothetical protein